MRLGILDNGHSFGTKAMFFVIKTMTRKPVPDVVKTLRYRDDFFGKTMNGLFQSSMRGPSPWSVGDRELMAAYVSKMNECEF
jgi:hypothetical protein